MKKLIAMLCVVAMIVSLCGCGGAVEEINSTVVVEEGSGENTVSGDVTESNTANSNTSTNNAVSNNEGSNNAVSSNTKIDNPLNVDLKGATITIYDISTFNLDASDSKTNKAKVDMLKKIQSDLNCKFKVTTTDEEKMKLYVTTSASSGKALGGIIAPSMYNAGYYISSNLVTNLTKVSSMDLSKDYMNRYNVLNASQFGSAKYAVAAEGEARTYMIFFNKRILKEMGYSENYIYDLVDSGKWTYDVYREIAKKAMKDLDGAAGYSANDQWGQIMQEASTGTSSNIIAAFGASMLKLSSNGKLTYNMTDSKMIEALNLANDVINKDGTFLNVGGTNDDAKSAAFANGKGLFLFASVHFAKSLSGMKDEYGLVPLPQVTNTKNYASAVDWNTRVLMMPAGLSAKDQYNAGAVIQAYQYLYDGILDTMEKEYVNRYFYDDKSGANFKLAAAGMKTMPEYLYAQSNETILSGTYRIFWDYFNGKTNSPVSNIEAQKSAVEKSLDEINAKIKDN